MCSTEPHFLPFHIYPLNLIGIFIVNLEAHASVSKVHVKEE